VGELPSFESLPEHLRSVLVVDDNPFFLRFLSHLLASSGLNVLEAATGDEALQVALERRPWLILTDVQMPGDDGFEFCRKVRSHSLIRHTPLIFLSGWDDYKERYRGLEVGADEYLSKETPIRELLIRIQLILRRYSELGQRGRRGPGMEGSIEVVGAPGFLQMCHLGRLTGVCSVRAEEETAQIRLRAGEIVGADVGAKHGADAVFAFLAWTRGHFEFAPGDPGDGAPLGESFDQLVLEGCRRLDEAAR
jgi:DNA-binding response OmpR family regulator